MTELNLTKEDMLRVEELKYGYNLQSNALDMLIAIGESLIAGTHVLVTKDDAEKIWQYNDLCR